MTLIIAIFYEGIFSFLFASIAKKNVSIKLLAVAALLGLGREIDVIYRLSRSDLDDATFLGLKTTKCGDILLLRALCLLILDATLVTFASRRFEQRQDIALWMVVGKFTSAILDVVPTVNILFSLGLLVWLCRAAGVARRTQDPSLFYLYSTLACLYLLLAPIMITVTPPLVYFFDRFIYTVALFGLFHLQQHVPFVWEDPTPLLGGSSSSSAEDIQLADIIDDDELPLSSSAEAPDADNTHYLPPPSSDCEDHVVIVAPASPLASSEEPSVVVFNKSPAKAVL